MTEVLRGEDGVLRLTLDRPDALNAFDGRLGPALRDALADAAEDDAVRAVLLTGAGASFSAGADLKAGAAPMGDDGKPDLAWVLRDVYNPIVLSIRRMGKPVVAAVNGPAAGVGCSIALACDLLLAADTAVFAFGFTRIGLAPDGGASVFLPARLGHARTFELALQDRRIDAVTAFDWGLVNSVHPADRLLDEASKTAAALAAGPPRSYATVKRLVNDRLYPGLEAALDAEAVAQGEHGRSEDFVEGVMAFLQKRTPAFTGR